MSLFTPSNLDAFAEDYRQRDWSRVNKSATRMLSEAAADQQSRQTFDVFLSHSFSDASRVLGVYALLKAQGLNVYVDWIVDAGLDRAKVDAQTAETLRTRMRQSKVLIYGHSLNSSDSKWMPWELGYFDGFRSAVAILPISQTGNGSTAGVEYLNLYPYIDTSGAYVYVNQGNSPERLFGKRPSSGYSFKTLRDWIGERG